MEFYNNQTLLSKLDINNKKPEIYGCVGNRTAGKTYCFNRYMLNQFVKKKEKFMLLYRYKYELSDVSEKFFNSIENEFSGSVMTSKSKGKGSYIELFLNDDSCGYAVSINGYAAVKKYSHYFNDVKRMLFDEFQNEDNQYLVDEINKLISIHTSVARGINQPVRYVPLYLLSNTVSLLNPYYTAFSIAEKIQEKTKFLRGDGFVFEFCFNETASKLQKDSAFNRAFKGSKEIEYMANNVYLNDNKCLIDKSGKKKQYLCTLLKAGVEYAVNRTNDNMIYIDKAVDQNFPIRYACNLTDITENSILVNELIKAQYRKYFNNAIVRFKDLESKAAFIDFVKY